MIGMCHIVQHFGKLFSTLVNENVTKSSSTTSWSTDQNYTRFAKNLNANVEIALSMLHLKLREFNQHFMICNPDLLPEPNQLLNPVHKNYPSYFYSFFSNSIKNQTSSICKHSFTKNRYNIGPTRHSYKTPLLQYFDFFFFFLHFVFLYLCFLYLFCFIVFRFSKLLCPVFLFLYFFFIISFFVLDFLCFKFSPFFRRNP